MSFSHIPEVLQRPAMGRLAAFIRRPQHQGDQGLEPPELERFEQEVHAHLMAIERDVLAEELSRYDVMAAEVTVEGVSYRCRLESTQTYLSAAGPLPVRRHLDRPAGRQTQSICPLERRAGIVQGLWTPRAARQGAFAMAHLTPRESATLFEELGGMPPSVSTWDRLPKTLSAHDEANRESWEEEWRVYETVATEAALLAVSLDGVMAPMATLASDAEADQAAIEPAEAPEETGASSDQRHYREASCGAVTLYDGEGHRLSTIRDGRMPEYQKATWCAQLEAECQSLVALRPDLQGVKLADGAAENGRFLDHLDLGLSGDTAPVRDPVCMLDFYPAADHLKPACDVIWGAGSGESKAEFVRLRTLLKEDEDGVDKVINRLRYRVRQMRGRNRDEVEKDLTYVRTQRSRMRYGAYRQANLPIGSGVVEAACKTLVSARLKRSGMRWGMAGGQAILTLRSVIQSGRWERAWSLWRNDFQKPVVIVATDGHRVLKPAA